MTASLLIEEESGTYSGRIRHSHNGYYAGDFSQTPPSATELRASYAGRREVPAPRPSTAHEPWQPPSQIPDRAEHRPAGCLIPAGSVIASLLRAQ